MEVKKSPIELFQGWQEDCAEIIRSAEYLNAWEVSFITSIEGRLKNGFMLTDNQQAKLEQIKKQIMERFD